MIGFMPEPYPDELLYSVLSRYHSQSGYLVYRACAEVLFTDPLARPDVEFVNRYTEELLRALDVDMETLVRNHTMFPAYAMFLPYKRKKAAFTSMIRMDGKHKNLLAIPTRKTVRTLRYCPVCVEEDRKRYGETYWHRSSQIQGICVCPLHGCYLKPTEVILSGKATPAFITA